MIDRRSHAEGKLVKSQPTRLLLESLPGLPVESFLFGSQTIEIDSYTCFQVYVFHLSSPHLNPLGQQLKMNSVPFKVHSVLPEHFMSFPPRLKRQNEFCTGG